MPAQRVSMRPVREVFRLTWACGLRDRQMAPSLRVRRPPVAAYVRRAPAAGLAWPLPAPRDALALAGRLWAMAAHTPLARRPPPDWALVHQERRRQGVTVLLVGQAYQARTPDGLQYRPLWQA
jgi:hypothetical protein